MRWSKYIGLTIFSVLMLTNAAIACDDDDDDATASASTKAYSEANHTMMKHMHQDYTGDADVDFVSGMIPHHQGAVDMAKVELQYGKDPELHKLAQDIIASQQKEIAFMQAWRKKNHSH